MQNSLASGVTGVVKAFNVKQLCIPMLSELVLFTEITKTL